jgi:hypothetical protein
MVISYGSYHKEIIVNVVGPGYLPRGYLNSFLSSNSSHYSDFGDGIPKHGLLSFVLRFILLLKKEFT